MVRSAANPEQALFLDKLLKEGTSVLSQKVRNVMESELASARGGKSMVTVLLNDNNSVLRAIREHCAQGRPLSGVLAEVVHEIYHNARSYAEPGISQDSHILEHRNAMLARMLEIEQSLSMARNERDQLKD